MPSLPLWLIGIYIAFFGIASQRYENKIDIIENRANSIFTQLGTGAGKSALERIPTVQNYPCPIKPEILNPDSVFRSIFGKNTVYTEILKLLRGTIEDWKNELKQINLKGTNHLSTNLKGVNFVEANILYCNFEGADLERRADLDVANLKVANLNVAYLKGASFNGANLQETNLQEARGLTVEQLSKVKTLYKAKLDPELMEQVKEKYPHLLEAPKEAE